MYLARWRTVILVILLWRVLEGLKKNRKEKWKHWKCHTVWKACMKRSRAVFQHTDYKSFSNCFLKTAAVVWFLKFKSFPLMCYQRWNWLANPLTKQTVSWGPPRLHFHLEMDLASVLSWRCGASPCLPSKSIKSYRIPAGATRPSWPKSADQTVATWRTATARQHLVLPRMAVLNLFSSLIIFF